MGFANQTSSRVAGGLLLLALLGVRLAAQSSGSAQPGVQADLAKKVATARAVVPVALDPQYLLLLVHVIHPPLPRTEAAARRAGFLKALSLDLEKLGLRLRAASESQLLGAGDGTEVYGSQAVLFYLSGRGPQWATKQATVKKVEAARATLARMATVVEKPDDLKSVDTAATQPRALWAVYSCYGQEHLDKALPTANHISQAKATAERLLKQSLPALDASLVAITGVAWRKELPSGSVVDVTYWPDNAPTPAQVLKYPSILYYQAVVTVTAQIKPN